MKQSSGPDRLRSARHAGRADGAKREEVGKCLKKSSALEAKGCPKGCAISRLCFATRLTSSKLRKQRRLSEKSFQSRESPLGIKRSEACLFRPDLSSVLLSAGSTT